MSLYRIAFPHSVDDKAQALLENAESCYNLAGGLKPDKRRYPTPYDYLGFGVCVGVPMGRIRLAYRDPDRMPVISCVQEMAHRHYGLDVEVVHLPEESEYESCLFDGRSDVLIEHLEFLYAQVARGRHITFLCAPMIGNGFKLVVPQTISSLDDLKGGSLAVRAQGRPHSVLLWLSTVGLHGQMNVVLVPDKKVGRWGQWKKVASGECAATFVSPIYLPEPLAAGLKVLPVPDVPVVGNFAQACLTNLAIEHEPALLRYLKAVIHALCLLKHRQTEALAIASNTGSLQSGIDQNELGQRIAIIAESLSVRPYPTPEAVLNTYEIATAEYPDAQGINPLVLWDLHWIKWLDETGFIKEVSELVKSPTESPC